MTHKQSGGFTDEELLRFENSQTDGFACTSIDFKSKKALIARLRAAEAALELSCECSPSGLSPCCTRYKTWLASKGESNGQ